MLTDAKIRGLKVTPGDRLELPDKLVPGLRLRVTTGSKTWVLRQRAGGKVRTFTIGAFGDAPAGISLAKARTAAHALRDRIDAGEIPQTGRPDQGEADGRLAAVVDTFMVRHAKARVKRPEAYDWMFRKYVIPRWGDWQMTAIKRRDLADWLDEVADRHGMTTARRVGGLVKRLFRFALSRDIVEIDAAAGVILPGAEVVRERVLSDAEIAALWRATDPGGKTEGKNKAGRPQPHPSDYPWGPFIRLMLLTGQRRGEVAAMQWEAIDLDEGTWRLAAAETKSARAHLVPLAPAAVDILRGLPRLVIDDGEGGQIDSPWVFTTNGAAPIDGFSKPKAWLDTAMLADLQKADPAAALAGWRLHDLRRTVATGLARLGVDPFTRRRCLNHAATGIDAVYDQHDYLGPKRAALDLWAAAVLETVNGPPAGTKVVQLRRPA